MSERDDPIDSFGFNRFHGAANGLDVVAETDGLTGARCFRRVRSNDADECNALLAELGDDVGIDTAFNGAARRRFDIGTDHGERHAVEEGGQFLFAIIELVIAEGEQINADRPRHLGLQRALVGGVEQRALEVIARRHDKGRPAQFGLALFDRGLEPREASEAFARLVVFGRTVRVEAVDRLNARVRIVDVQDVERELLRPGGGSNGEGRNAKGQRGQARRSGTGEGMAGGHGWLLGSRVLPAPSLGLVS